MGPASPAASRPRAAGFALIVTIVLVAFLVLILVGLATFTRVETQVATNTQSQAQARQNALFALNLALGQLQRHTGPDQRVTATADILLPSGANVANADTGAQAQAKLDTYWRAQRNRRWTGAWLDGNTAAFNADTPAASNPAPDLQAWLVSGNESAASFSPETRIPGLTVAAATAANAATVTFDDANGEPHRLLIGPGTVAVSAAADLDRLVTAPQRPISATNVPGFDPATSVVTGHYAWWVGDEGVKARADVIDRHAAASAGGDADSTRARRQSAQRPVIEAITTSGTDGFVGLYPANDTILERVLDLQQLGFASADPDLRTRVREHHHDITIHSRGVLSNARHGGLKQDLTHILSRPTEAAFRTALNQTSHGFNPAPSGSHNNLISGAGTRYASAFPAPGGGPAYADIFNQSATWEQLWSFANMGRPDGSSPPGARDLGGAVIPRVSTATRQGVYPVLTHAKFFYNLRITEAVLDADGVNRGGTIQVEVVPVVVLANPYNAPLAPADYILRVVNSPAIQLRFGTWNSAAGEPDPNNFVPAPGYTNLGRAYTGEVRLVLRNENGLAPGEARIFSLDTNATIPATAAAQAATTAVLIDELDPDTRLTFSTGQSIPPEHTHAALYTTNSAMNIGLYLDSVSVPNQIALIQSRRPSGVDLENPANGFLVYPLSNNRRQGGGVFLTVADGATTQQQQANFLQLNYRTPLVQPVGTLGNNTHPLEWGRAFIRTGATGGDTDTPNPYLEAHLLRRPGDPARVRWGLANTGIGLYLNQPPAHVTGDAGFINLLYDLPAPDAPIASLGQLQHFNLAGHFTGLASHANSTRVHTWQSNYPISNSYATGRVPRDQVFNSTGALGYHYDGTYLLNDILWDRFYFSTFPTSGAFDFGSASDRLVNHRYRPFRPASEVPWNDPSRYRGVFNAAQNLLVKGAFNINSTSVEAWKAVLSGLRGVPIGSESSAANLTAPFTRTLVPTGGASGAKAGNTENAWTGFRNLTRDEVNDIAHELALQARRRGPYLSLSQFVNRRLASSGSDQTNLGVSGALQAAIDKVINLTNDAPAPLNLRSSTGNLSLADLAYRAPNLISGFPGYLLQGDVLSALGPTLSARSDTFVIRTYGGTTNPTTGAAEAHAWCEAVVQRLPDYVDPSANASDTLPAAGTTNALFGRRYQIVSFRWLGPADI